MREFQIVLIIIIIVLIVVLIIRSSKQSGCQRDRRNRVETGNISPIRIDKHGRRYVENPSQNYKVLRNSRSYTDDRYVRNNRPRISSQPRSEERRQVKAFPRTKVNASRPAPKPQRRIKVEKPNERNVIESKIKERENSRKVTNGLPKSIVTSIPELFSPKINYEEEYGVSKEELDALVEDYKKGKEYKERKLPINKNFNLNKYTNAQETIRQSMVDVPTHGSKKGFITADIYKKYGKNFTKKDDSRFYGGVSALEVTAEQHKNVIAKSKGRSSKGVLVDRR